MISIKDYKIIKELHHGSQSIVYSAIHVDSAKPRVISYFPLKVISEADIAYLTQECQKLKELKSEYIAQIYSAEYIYNPPGFILIDEYLDGISLTDYIIANKIALIDVLNISIQISDAIIDIHTNGLMHGDIKPSSIIINPGTGKIKIKNFGFHKIITYKNEELYRPDAIKGTLPYISPEQTGRTNRDPDYRSDFYSIGMTIYKMLTGETPFQNRDPLEIIHAHIAKKPNPPSVKDMHIPQIISDIVIKLISKNPEKRYQSGYGLKKDLEICLNQLRDTGKIDSFPLGAYDLSDKFIIPQKIYGRETEISRLISIFDKVSQGSCEVILIKGSGGIGKTALVKEIYNTINQHKGYCISCKFELLKKEIPLNAIIQAFQIVMQQILSESSDRRQLWKERLQNAVGQNGRIITDMIPEVEELIGPQPSLQDVSPEQSQNRFKIVFQNFVNLFQKKEHPLIIFLDDLQWADTASLNLINTIINDSSVKYTFIILSFRHNEINESHPVKLWLDSLKNYNISINEEYLQPLDFESTNQLIADTLKRDYYDSEPLAKIVQQKTGGNPFFLKQFLKMLYDNKIIFFKAPNLPSNKERKKSGWQWDMNLLQEMQVTENIVELLTSRILNLPETSQNILQAASIIGNIFELDALAEIYDKSITDTLNELNISINNGLVIYTKDGYKFAHDRIHEAAYSMIPDEMKKELHLKMGNLLLNRINKNDDMPEKIFTIIDHFNKCIDLITDDKKMEELALLNLLAGKKAKSSAAYSSAVKYLDAALSLLPNDLSEKNGNLNFTILLEKAECLYLLGDFDNSENLFNIVIKNTKTVYEKAKVFSLKILLLTNQNRYDDAINLGIEALKLFHVKVSSSPAKITIIKELIKTKILLINRNIADLSNLPTMEDSTKLTVMAIFEKIIQPTYFSSIKSHKNLMALIVLKMLNLTLKYGNSKYSPYTYVAYATIIGPKLGEYKTAYEFGKLAIALYEKSNNAVSKAQVYVIFSGMINHWVKSGYTSIEYLTTAIQAGMESGDLTFTANGITQFFYHSIRIGENLDLILKKFETYQNLLNKIKHQEAIDTVASFYRMVLVLKGLTSNSTSYNDDHFSETDFINRIKGRVRLEYIYFLTKIESLYIFGYYKEALQYALKIYKDFDEIVFGVINVPEFFFYFSLSLTAYLENINDKNRKKYLKILYKNIEKMQLWSTNCPENFLHQYLLIKAEISKINGNNYNAMQLYNQAIAEAEKNNYINHEAIACELAANLYIKNNNFLIARALIMHGINCYHIWGADAKLTDLEKKYSSFLNSNNDRQFSPAQNQLDYISVVYSLQAISSEIILDDLLKKLMRIAVKNAGASRGLFISNKNNNLYIEAECLVENEEKTIIRTSVLDEKKDILLSIINSVWTSKKHIVIDDARKDKKFSLETYVIKNQPKSILCLPVIRQSKLIGILYLENNIISGAFTPNRVEILQLLASQAAISIENARLYKSIQESEMELRSLSKKREELERIINRSPVIFIQWRASENWLIDFVSNNIISFGYNPNDFYSNNIAFSTIIHSDDFKRISSEVAKYSSQNNCNSFVLEYRIITKNGNIRWIEDHTWIIRNDNNEIMHYQGLIMDITERKIAEKALKESIEQYQLLLETMNEGVVVIDENGILTYVNSRFCEMLGYPINEILKYPLSNFIDKTNLELFSEQLSKRRLGKSEPYEIDFIKKNNRKISMTVSPRPIFDDGGKFIGSFGLFSDITDKKKLEDDFLKASKLESLGVFAGGIAHDFNNLLTAIVGNISLAKLKINREDKIYEILSEAERASLRAKDLTHQLLTFSRGGSPIKKTTSIKNFLKDTADFILSGSNVKCEYNILDDLWDVEVDEGQITQVIQNLIINAKEAIPEGGTIRVSAENITLKVDNKLALVPGNYIKIIIADEGIGISQDKLPFIFDPYFTTKERGSGLGLTVTYSIIKKHDGYIMVESEVGKGTTFTIYLHALKDHKIVQEQAIPEVLKKDGKILLMDDDEIVLRIAGNMLEYLGFRVEHAKHGEEAIELYKKAMENKEPFDIIIMDLTIPGKMGGKEAIKRLKEIDPDVKAIVSSGYSNDPVMANYSNYGFCGVMAKPYRIEEVKIVLNKVFEKN